MLKVTVPYLDISPQYHSASWSEYTGGKMQLLFMVDVSGLVDLGGSAVGTVNELER